MSSDRPVWRQHSHRAEDRYVVALRGELGMGVVDELRELLTASIAQGPLHDRGPAHPQHRPTPACVSRVPSQSHCQAWTTTRAGWTSGSATDPVT